MTKDKYNIAAIRELLQAAFGPRDLRRFCEERPYLSPVLVDLPSNFSLAEIVDRVIEFCQKQDVVAELLADVQACNPRQYEKFASQLYVVDPSPDRPETLPAERCPGSSTSSEAEVAQMPVGETRPEESPRPLEASPQPAPVPSDQDWGKALRDWLGLILAMRAGLFSWLLRDNLGGAGVDESCTGGTQRLLGTAIDFGSLPKTSEVCKQSLILTIAIS